MPSVIPDSISAPMSHLSDAELACHDGTPYPSGPPWDNRKAKLKGVFEAIRAEWNLPITVNSAYRTPIYQARLNQENPSAAATTSQHCQGRALDLLPPEGVSVYDFWARIVEIAPRVGITAIGYASPSQGGYVHIDIRPMPPGSPLVQWTYPLSGG